jgi:hypothetical protein
MKVLLITLLLTLCEGVEDNTVAGSSPSFIRQVIHLMIGLLFKMTEAILP